MIIEIQMRRKLFFLHLYLSDEDIHKMAGSVPHRDRPAEDKPKATTRFNTHSGL